MGGSGKQSPVAQGRRSAWLSRLGVERDFNAYVQPLQVATGIAVCTAMAGAGYYPILSSLGLAAARDWYASMQWAAITTLLVTQPMLGATLQTCIERAFGTMMGGAVGYLINAAFFHVVNIIVMAAFASFVFVVGFSAIGLNYAAKIGAMTMLIVSMGGFNRGTVAATLQLAVSRTSGILVGVGVGAVVSTLLFQQTASDKTLKSFKRALALLSEFNEEAWDSLPQDFSVSPAPTPNEETTDKSKVDDSCKQPLPAGQAVQSFRTFRRKVRKSVPKKLYEAADKEDVTTRNIAAAQKATSVMTALSAARSAAAVARHEKYVYWQRTGLSFFLPTWPCRVDSLPFDDLEMLGMAILDVCRLVWSFDFALIQGFDEDTQAKLRKRLPPGMLPSIRRTATDALKGLREMFPSHAILEEKMLDAWEHVLESVLLLDQLVELLLDISMWNRHQTLAELGRAAGGWSTAPEDVLSQSRRSSFQQPSSPFDEQASGDDATNRRQSSGSGGTGGFGGLGGSSQGEKETTTTTGGRLPMGRAFSRQPTFRSNQAMLTPVREGRRELVTGGLESLTMRARTLSRQMSTRHSVSPTMSPTGGSRTPASPPTTASIQMTPRQVSATMPASLAEEAQEQLLFESLGEMPDSLVKDRLFADSPAGFIQEVRWVTFAYELKNFSEALSSLAQMMANIVEQLPEAGPTKKNRDAENDTHEPPRKSSSASPASKGSSPPAQPQDPEWGAGKTAKVETGL